MFESFKPITRYEEFQKEAFIMLIEEQQKTNALLAQLCQSSKEPIPLEDSNENVTSRKPRNSTTNNKS